MKACNMHGFIHVFIIMQKNSSMFVSLTVNYDYFFSIIVERD